MKYRESGMPSEQIWDTFFNPIETLEQLEIDKNIRNLIDIGCGYGTFLLPATKLISGTAIGIDIDPDMIDICNKKMQQSNILNMDMIQGDICTESTVRALENYKQEVDYITLFNILHCEEPVKLLGHVYDVLNLNGKIGIIHWIHKETPRGPSVDIRPKPEMIIEWAEKVGFTLKKQIVILPYHFGLVFEK